jgi:hypothetical protein
MNKSYTKSNTNNKAFCKVCKDAGKCESIYTSHGIKNERGQVVCPTLLEQSCRYCLKNGHTVKYCPSLAKNEKEDKRQTNKEIYKNKNTYKITSNTNKNKNKSLFAALCDETSSDEEKEKEKIIKKKVDEFPPLVINNSKNENKKDIKNASISMSYKNIITITKDQVRLKQEKEEEEEIFKRLNVKKYIKEQINVVEAPIVAPLRKRNWADVYSSDEEDEDEDEDLYNNIKKSKFLENYTNPYDSD